MSITLSNKLNFRVNDYPIILNEELQESSLNQHKIIKANFFHRFMIKPAKDEIIYWSKNCDFSYIDKDYKNSIVPILHTKVGAHSMYGTTAYLRFKANLLSKFIFQIIRNEYPARLNLEKYEEKIIEIIGNPASADQCLKTWELNDEKMIIEFPKNKKHGYIYLMFN